MAGFADRLAFVPPPFNLASVAAATDAFEGGLLVLDYIQRIPPPGEHADKRGSVDASMNHLRQFAEAGVGVVVISAVGRGKDTKGRSTYDGDALNLASFRESSELEFGCDDAFILAPDAKNPALRVLRHLKSRHGEARDIGLGFDGATQRFTSLSQGSPASEPEGKGKGGRSRCRAGDKPEARARLAGLWERTAPASEDDPEGGNDES